MTVKEEFKIINQCLCIEMPGEIDHHNAKGIIDTADEMMCREEVKHLVFDFSQTEFMDSSGIGIIIGRYKKIRCFGGKVFCIHANVQIRKILYTAGLKSIVEIVEDSEYDYI